MANRILLLATKDTIAYAPGRRTVATGAQLLASVPARSRGTEVVVEDVLAEPGWDITPSTMFGLARRVRSAILDDGFGGVVLTHGLDTIEETAFLVDLLAGEAAGRGGIVLTGAVRRLDDPATDGPGNLAAALAAAADPALREAGAVVCAHDELHAARWVTMLDAAGDAPVSSVPFPVLGRIVGAGQSIDAGQVELLAAPPPRPPAAVGVPESQVALVKTYPGMDSAQLTAVVDAGARGIVLEGTGRGNVPVSVLSAIEELTGWDIPVVVGSRCWTGPADLDDLDLPEGLAARVGAIGARGLTPTKARYALMAALGGGGVDAVRAWFARL
jgi:L-asparaginase